MVARAEFSERLQQTAPATSDAAATSTAPATAAGTMRVQQQLFDLIHAVTGQRRLLTVPRPLAGFMGSLEGGLFLSQLLYWSDRSTAPGSRHGWFYKSFPEWEAETMLSEYKVRKYTDICRERGFLEVDVRPVRGIAVTHYRLHLDRLQQQLVAHLRGAPPAKNGGHPPVKSSATPHEGRPASAEKPPDASQNVAPRPPENSAQAPEKVVGDFPEKSPPSLTESTPEPTAENTTKSTTGPPSPFDAGDWHAVLDELRRQLPAATFEQALHRCRFLRQDGDLLLIAARSPYAADWINHRLRPVVERTLNGWLRAGGVSGRPLRVRALPPCKTSKS